MKITIDDIKILRQQTGAGLLVVKNALNEAGGDLVKAKTIIKERGQLIAAKKSDRDIKEGVVASYIHTNNKVGAMVELLCETDFVARNQEFKDLAHNLALQITASNPSFIKPKQASPDFIKQQRFIAEKAVETSDKLKNIKDKIIDGKVNKAVSEAALYNQAFVKDPNLTIKDLITEAITKLGENIEVGRFSRFEI